MLAEKVVYAPDHAHRYIFSDYCQLNPTVLLTVQMIAPRTENTNIAQASLIHFSWRSPPSTMVGTALSITMKQPHGNMNAMKNAILEPIKLQTVATPLTATAPK